MNPWRLAVSEVVKEFSGERGAKTRALDGVSVEIAAGDWIVIVGPNGSGKSTLLNLLAGRFRPDRGTVTLERDGGKTDWYALPLAERAGYFAYIHQDPRAGSFVNLTVAENLRMASLSSSRLWRRLLRPRSRQRSREGWARQDCPASFMRGYRSSARANVKWWPCRPHC